MKKKSARATIECSRLFKATQKASRGSEGVGKEDGLRELTKVCNEITKCTRVQAARG